jgi:hypothetical protein
MQAPAVSRHIPGLIQRCFRHSVQLRTQFQLTNYFAPAQLELQRNVHSIAVRLVRVYV